MLSPDLHMYNDISLVHYGMAEVILAEMPEDSMGTWVGGRRQQMAVPLSLSSLQTHACALSHTHVAQTWQAKER